MKKITPLFLVSLLTLAFFGLLITSGSAHKTGGEIRTLEGCDKLKKPQKKGACKKCINKGKTHYHPRRKPGKRCRPNNGKP